jgi:p-aminobenzoyl-glutamate transporter AbgT
MIKLIILIVIAVVILGYFNIDVRDITESPKTIENLAYIKGLALQFINYIVELFVKLWESIKP